jgi:hypothetical protein
MLRSVAIATALLLCALSLKAQSINSTVIGSDTINYRYTPIDQTPRFEEFGLRVFDYLHLLPDEQKRANIAAFGLPAYSANTGLRFVVVGNLEYRNITDTKLIDNLHIEASASLTGYYNVRISGNNNFKNRQHSLLYLVEAESLPTYIYGLNFDTSSEGNPGSYTGRSYRARLKYSWHATSFLTLSTSLDYIHKQALNLDSRAAEIVAGRASKYSGLGASIAAEISTIKGDKIENKRGVYFGIKGFITPSVLSSYRHTLWQAEATFNYYQPLWPGALLALDIYAQLQSQQTPWTLRLGLGSDERMRGYYHSRYNGNTLLGGQLELRQRVWEGLVIATWGGAATVASNEDPLAWHKILPDYGAGIRYYTSPNTAIRLDLGIGRHGLNFVVGLNESF